MHSAVVEQKMADLPKDRLEPAPPFTFCAVDYFVGVDDILIIKDDNAPRNRWQLARVCAVNRSSDGRVRTVKLALADACLDKKGRRVKEVKFLERPVQKLVLLMSKDDYESESRGESQPRSH